jgi:hypothetical protein
MTSEKKIINFLGLEKIKQDTLIYRLFLDSDLAIWDQKKGSLQWEIVRNKESVKDGRLYIPPFVKKIKAIKMEPFLVSHLPGTQYTPLPLVNLHNQMLIEEFKTDSFITSNSNFHFIWSIDGHNWYNYIKYELLQEIDLQETITLRLLYDLSYIPFSLTPYHESFTEVVKFPDNFLYIQVYLDINTDFDGCTLSGFTTNDPVTDAAIIEEINSYVLQDNYIKFSLDGITYIKTEIDISILVPPPQFSYIVIHFPQTKYKIKYNIPLKLYY